LLPERVGETGAPLLGWLVTQTRMRLFAAGLMDPVVYTVSPPPPPVSPPLVNCVAVMAACVSGTSKNAIAIAITKNQMGHFSLLFIQPSTEIKMLYALDLSSWCFIRDFFQCC
jgi:hypothetical protein